MSPFTECSSKLVLLIEVAGLELKLTVLGGLNELLFGFFGVNNIEMLVAGKVE
jgi:uncharacterized membrane protein YuzA (DUF378 family)